MGVKKVIKKGLTLGFRPMQWIGVEHVKANGRLCSQLVNDLMGKNKTPEQVASQAAAEAEERGLTSAQLASRKTLAVFLMLFYIVAELSAFAYAGYLWFSKGLIAQGAMSVIVGLLLSVSILRELLIFYQIKLKRHRLNLKELAALLFQPQKHIKPRK